MDRCALFVDAGYVLADGAMAVHGTRRRESVSWDYAGLVQLFGNLATERTSLSLLRCYWYEATVEGLRSAEHDTLADLPGVKLRVAKARPGRREGVEADMHRDLTTLARNKAVSDVMVVSAEEDLAQVIAYVQDMGMRVTLLHIAVDGEGTAPRALRQEADDFMEISATQLRPYVELISGAEPPRPDEAGSAPEPQPAAHETGAFNGNGYAVFPAPQPAAADASPSDPGQPDASQPDAGQPDLGQPEGAESAAAADYAPVADFAASVDYSASVDYGAPAPAPAPAPAAVEPPAAVEQPAAVDYSSPFDYGSAPDYGPVREYTTPVTAAVPVPPREEPYPAPVAVPAAADERRGDRDRLSATGRLNADLSAYTPGAVREPYQRDGGFREAAADTPGRLQPVPVPAGYAGSGSAQVRRLPTRPGMLPAGPNPGQPVPGSSAPAPPAPALVTVPPSAAPPAAPEAAGPHSGGPQLNGPVPGGPPPGGHLPVGPPTGAQPVVPVAPVVPMDPGGMGYGAARGGAPGAPRPVLTGPGGPGGPVGLAGPGDNQGFGAPPALAPVAPGSQPPPAAPPAPAVPPGPGAPSGPIGLVGPGGYPGAPPGVSLADAVQSAHEEGQAFGESVARDAPALWLEAVLARKPRMPSDLEARLLQGSALPIDFLLHDEVRHALRRGFWDALERARR